MLTRMLFNKRSLFIFTESRNPARELIDALRQDEPGLEVATDAGKVKCRHLDLSIILELGTDTALPNSENRSLLLQNGEKIARVWNM